LPKYRLPIPQFYIFAILAIFTISGCNNIFTPSGCNNIFTPSGCNNTGIKKFQFTGTVSVISNDPQCKDDKMFDSQRYSWNLNLIKNMEDFPMWKVFISVSFFVASKKQETPKNRKEKKQFELKKNMIIIYLIRQWFQGYTVANQAFPYLYEVVKLRLQSL